jgi:adhesin/invasin
MANSSPGFLTVVLACLSAVTLTAAPQLRLSSSTVGPIYVQAGSNGPAQSINAFNIGDGALNLTAASSNSSWLNGTVVGASTCSGGPVSPCIPVNIALNTAGLAIGSYTEYLTLADPNAIDAPQVVTVTVQVNGAPTNAEFYITPNNGASTAQSDTAFMTVNTTGTVISTVKTVDANQWLNFVLFGGNHVLYTGYEVRVTAQPGQAEGNYSGTVILSGSVYSSDNKTINVNLHVTSQPIVQFPSSPVTFNLVQGQAAQTYNVSLPNVGLGSLATTGANANASTGGSWLSAAPAGSNTIGVTANPSALAPGSYFGTVTLVSNAANTAVPIPVRVNVAAPGNPVVFFGGVVDNAAFATGQAVAAGSVAAVFGTQLSASAPAYASSFPLPTNLGGVQVLINGVAAPLFYADANQVDFQIPTYLGAGQITIQVLRNGQPGNRVSATVDSVAPRLFALRQLPSAPDGSPFGVVNNSDGTLAIPSNLGPAGHPAHRGDVITIFALGLGPVSPAVNTGDPAPSVEPLARTTNQVQVTYGGSTLGATTATAIYAGLAPGFAGLYQINVLIPLSAPTGNVPVTITLPGHTSNVVEMAISAQ